MLSRFVGAALVLVIGGVVLAGEYSGVVTSVSDTEVKITIFNRKEKTKDEKTFKSTKDVKITKADGESGTIADLKTAIDESKGKVKGVRAKVTTKGEGDKETVTKIDVAKPRKKN
jgi:hypothetical protein